MCASSCSGCCVCHRCSQTQGGTFTAIRVLDVVQSLSIFRRDLAASLVRGPVAVSVATIPVLAERSITFKHVFRCVSVHQLLLVHSVFHFGTSEVSVGTVTFVLASYRDCDLICIRSVVKFVS